MEFLRSDKIPRTYGDVVFREARRGKLIVFLVFLGITLGALYLGVFPERLPAGFRPPSFVAFLVAAGFFLFALVGLYTVRASFLPSNWLVRFDGSTLYVKYRSYLNHHFPMGDQVVVRFPVGKVAWVRKTREGRRLPDRNGYSSSTTTYLDIKLRDVDTSELGRRLDEERRRKAPMIRRTRTKVQHYPVRVVEPGMVRIDWRDHRTRITPGIDEAIRLLGRRIRVLEGEVTAQVPVESLSAAEQETRLLELVERGESLAAVRLVERLYNLSTTEARRFIDELAER